MSRAAVTHINLLARRTPSVSVATMLAALMVVTGVGLFVYGRQIMGAAWTVGEQRDALALQVKDVQAKLAVSSGEQARNARAVSLRQEIEVLQPRAQAAQALIAAVRTAEGGSAEDFRRVLVAASGVTESGLWLTQLALTAGGKKLEVQGSALSGGPVLRFAHRTNEVLEPMTIRMDSLEMQPVDAAAANGATPAGRMVSFRLY